MKIAGIILAAGFSRRMGKNKYHLLLGGRELYQYGADLLERLPLAKRLIVTNDAEIARYCIGKGIHPVSNGNAAEGKASSIRAGVDAAGQVDGYFFMTADQPLVSAVSCQKSWKPRKLNLKRSSSRCTEGSKGCRCVFRQCMPLPFSS